MKTLKKFALVLAALMALSCFAPMSAFAAESTPARVGYSVAGVTKVDVSGFTDVKDLTALPAANTNKNYKITDAAGLVKLATLVNGNTAAANKPFSGGKIYLANDIDMSKVDNFTPIGHTPNTENKTDDTSLYNINVFCGTFDGQGYTIDHLTINSTSNSQRLSFGLFGVIKGATIQNVVLGKNCSITYSGSGENVMVGAIVGIVYFETATVIQNCYSAATVNGGRAIVGGIVGDLHKAMNCMIQNCTNAGTVSGTGRVGGVLGMQENYNGATVQNCCNTGTIKQTSIGTSTGQCVGGICGTNNNKWTSATNYTTTTFINNVNYGKIEAKATPFAGGIVGCARTCTLTGNTDYGTVVINGETQEKTVVYGEKYDEATTQITESGVNQVLAGYGKAIIHGYQIKENGNDSVDVRFVGSIDSTKYASVGMEIFVTFTYQGATVVKHLDPDVVAGCNTTTVYNSLTAYNDENPAYTASALRGENGYLYSVVLTGIPKAAGDLTVTVVPFCKDADDATVYEGMPKSAIIQVVPSDSNPDPLPDNDVQ